MQPRTTVAVATTLAILVIAAGLALTAGPPPPHPVPPGHVSFAVLGDAPYYPWEEIRFRQVRKSLSDHELDVVIHVGDIFWQPCSDEMYRKFHGILDELPHPVVYTPGDNEWADCWEKRPGGWAPLERLKTLRSIFYPDPAASLGRRKIAVLNQGWDEGGAPWVENVRWNMRGLTFAAVHLPGSWNATRKFPGRSPEDDAEARDRLSAAVRWTRGAFAAARANGSRGVVLAFHANPGLERPHGHAWRAAWDPFVQAVEEEASAFSGPVLIMQGDDHEFIVDQPLVDRRTWRRLTNVTRVQVPGSPDVGWVRVIVSPHRVPSFAFEKHVVPGWKYW